MPLQRFSEREWALDLVIVPTAAEETAAAELGR
jgi:hypothetical protein